VPVLRPRIIPCLLVSNGGLVKTRRFQAPKYVGDPINAVKIFNEKQVDELCIFDIGAWRATAPDFALLQKVAVESRMPLCYGGGVVSAEQAQRIVNVGYEKVSLSSAAIRSPRLVSEVAAAIGSQSAVVTLDVAKDSGSGRHDVYVENGRKRLPNDLFELCDAVVAAGAGELVINSIDREGEMQGYDIELAKRLTARIRIPMTFMGGAGNVQHMRELIEEVGVVGAGAGTMFVFKGPFRAVLISYARP
jgi:imidazole glycerol-phosphate synthase subunit HisF